MLKQLRQKNLKTTNKKIRLDQCLVDQGLAENIKKAQAMIISGNVLVNDQPITKGGTFILEDAVLRLKQSQKEYVSRGAYKLKKAIEEFNIQVDGKTAIDVGASTGGFTEVLIEKGIGKVIAVDVGTNQLAWKIRSNPKVISKENYNVRNLKKEDFNWRFDLAVMDVSFISIKLLLPPLMEVMKKECDMVVLYKPQFELAADQIGEGGIVNSQEEAQQGMQDVIEWAQKQLHLSVKGMIPSPILGREGNQEYLIHWIRL